MRKCVKKTLIIIFIYIIMSDLNDDESVDESITSEEQVAIDKIQKVSFVKECVVKERAIEQAKKIISNPFNIWSIFGFSPANLLVGAGANTRQEAPFQLQRRLGMDKVVTINNIFV